MKKIQEVMFECFELGVDYGQLLMEEERESEETFDGFIGHCVDRKYNAPSHPTERRHLHSEKWFEAKRNSHSKFMELMKSLRDYDIETKKE